MSDLSIQPRSIVAAAVGTTYFEKSRIFRGRSEIRLGEALGDLGLGLSYQAAHVSTTVRNFTLSDVVLEADTLRLLKDGCAIPETSYFVAGDESLPASKGPPVRVEEDEDLIIGYNNVHWAYQHWLTQCIPAIDWSLRQPRARNARLLLPPLARWQEEILAILGYASIPRFVPEAGVRYWLPRVEYSDFLNGSTSFGVCLSAHETARRILHNLPPGEGIHQVLYVPCTNPYYGSIENEAEVIDLLRGRGVYVVDWQALGTVERISLFRHADVVIGPLGQGLSDVLFCKPGALLWEWTPRHHQNASFNRLAQAAEVDYWGDLFPGDPASKVPQRWNVDRETLARRLSQMSQRIALRAAGSGRAATGRPAGCPVGKPLDELMLAFENLGDNCEFGLVQRHAGVEPLGLLRFAGISLDRLIAALESRFDALCTEGTVAVYPAGEPGRREYMATASAYGLHYDTGVLEGTVEPSSLLTRETTRLGFLRSKLLEDLAGGEKIWVWRELGLTDTGRIRRLMDALRALGPNTLLWVVAADGDHPAGTVERLDSDFIKGYVERLAPYENATDIRPTSWFEVCENAFQLCYPDQAQPEAPIARTVAEPSRLSAMEFLALNRPPMSQVPTPPPAGPVRWYARLSRWSGVERLQRGSIPHRR